MNLKEYQEDVARTSAETKDDNLHMILGMLTELGELADQFKKNMASGKSIDFVNVFEELGDLMWYVAQFCNIHNTNLEDVIEANSAKLHARYPEKFTADAHDNRDLVKERQVLEGKSPLTILNDSEVLDLTKNM